MNATIVSYRRGRRTQTDNQMIIVLDGVTTRDDAVKMVGKTVAWIAPGAKKTTISGKVASAHGNSGALRVLFERGMPGQSLSNQVVVQ
ncbi:MAG: 50S ribosomal protein L35ae [Candidatus Woesearchaeota archaeon]